MKKILIPIVIALLVGTTFGIVLFKNIKEEIDEVFKDHTLLSLFQIGVFSNEENAKNVQKQYSGSVVLNDDIYYRVIYGVFQNKACIEKMKNYLEENKIEYHIREQNNSNEEFLNELMKYEEIILQTTDTEVFLKTIEQVLNLYKIEGEI